MKSTHLSNPVLATLLILLSCSPLLLHAQPAEVFDLRCEYLKAPLGIEEPHPRLSWKLQPREEEGLRGLRQTAYRVLAASSPERLGQDEGDLWDSRKVISDQSTHVEYAGKPLTSQQQCYWTVMVWDAQDAPGRWSSSSSWTMGLLRPEDWRGRWITAEEPQNALEGRSWIWSSRAPQGEPSLAAPGTRWFRTRFSLRAPGDLANATLSLAADNSFVAFVNGKKALAGGSWETFHEASLLELLVEGENVIAVAATNGGERPNPAGLFGALNLRWKSGDTRVIPVDTSWRVSERETPGWTELAFDDSGWAQAVEVARYGGGEWGRRPSVTNPLPLLRTSFKVSREVKRAELAICGLGFYEARLNGKALDDVVLEPGWTDYRKSCLYRVLDVSRLLQPGENALGVMLGNGMYNVTGGRYTKFTGSFGPPKLIAQLDIEYTDGSTEQVVTGDSWKTAPGPVVFSCIYGGEDYDATQERTGWDQPSFDASEWSPAKACEGPGGILTSRSSPHNAARETFDPVKITRPKPGVWVYDLGQNFSGWPIIEVQGPRGATVKLVTGELLDDQGLASQRSSGGPVWFSYTLKGQGVEQWRPRFSYSGFRYVQVEGAIPAEQAASAAGVPRIQRLQGQFLYPATAVDGTFACSNPEVNRVHALILAAIKSNFKSVLTDCPHREKLGWLECSHLLAGCFMFNYDCARFYSKIARDMRESQLPNGLVPDTAPEYVVFSGGFRDSPEWGSASVISPWRAYWMYGDRRILQDQYATMQRYVAYLGSKAKDGIVSHGLGDWYDIGPNGPGESQLTSMGLTATGVYYQSIEILRQVAQMLGKADDARTYGELGERVKRTLNTTFFKTDEGHYDRNSQTANAMPLFLGVVPPESRAAVLESLVRDVRHRGDRVTAGDVGFYYVVQALLAGGRSDVLYDMLCQTNGPGYRYQLKMNATSLTEAWDTNPSSSQNHCMLGHIEEWFYTGILGIRAEAPGFRKILLRPQIVGDLTWAEGYYDGPYGRISSAWKRSGDQVSLSLGVPPNSSATLFLPLRAADQLTEAGKPATESPGVRFLRQENGEAVFSLAPGTYRLTATL